jgi:hypothetical protein
MGRRRPSITISISTLAERIGGAPRGTMVTLALVYRAFVERADSAMSF